MAHRIPRSRQARARFAGLLLAVTVAVGLLLGMSGALGIAGAPAASAAEDAAAAGDLDADALPVHRALQRLRSKSGRPELRLDRDLTAGAQRDACALARGELALSGDARRLAESGAQRENLGLVVDSDPAAAARAMHDWWSTSPAHRADRLHPAMRAYGIGACRNRERTYYVERFAS